MPVKNLIFRITDIQARVLKLMVGSAPSYASYSVHFSENLFQFQFQDQTLSYDILWIILSLIHTDYKWF